MNRIIEMAALLLGGVSLFAVSFVAFVALSGKPLHEAPVIGRLFPAPTEPGHGEPSAAEGGSAEHDARATSSSGDEHDPSVARAVRSNEEVVSANVGMLGVFSLPSPYTTGELRALTDELKSRLFQVEQREHDLAEREHELQEEDRSLAERLASLQALQKELEAFELRLTEREGALERGEATEKQREQQKWAEVARVISGLEPEDAGSRLTGYEPADAARILRAMEDQERALELLNQIPEPRWMEYVEAYTLAVPQAAGRRGG
jgi:hypothetical protein